MATREGAPDDEIYALDVYKEALYIQVILWMLSGKPAYSIACGTELMFYFPCLLNRSQFKH
ncbi:MAG TPA: hypothetical protein VIM75_11455 [Ohtaekwangia sp.]|uniref:hypothetical protein n=1 Tax=Ohtaekwangia sp. TaxID=2066019 RepID=UPI002F95F45B